jgi:uncharacterized protein
MTENPKYSFMSNKLELRTLPGGRGSSLFAIAHINPDEMLCAWGGKVITEDELSLVTPYQQHHGIQIEDTLYMIPLVEGEAADYINHSCNPNCGIRGQICLVAMREIQPGEEICFDYAMSDSSDYDEFNCECGAPGCRGRVSGNDWMIPELQEKYQGYFSAYLQRRVDALRKK